MELREKKITLMIVCTSSSNTSGVSLEILFALVNIFLQIKDTKEPHFSSKNILEMNKKSPPLWASIKNEDKQGCLFGKHRDHSLDKCSQFKGRTRSISPRKRESVSVVCKLGT